MVPGAIVGAAGWTVLQYSAVSWSNTRCATRARNTGPSPLCSVSSVSSSWRPRSPCTPPSSTWCGSGASGRGMVQPPLTAADQEVMSSIALEGKRRPEQYVSTGFPCRAAEQGLVGRLRGVGRRRLGGARCAGRGCPASGWTGCRPTAPAGALEPERHLTMPFPRPLGHDGPRADLRRAATAMMPS